MTKKIALVYDAIYPYIKGGGEKRYYEIAKRLSIKGHEIHLYGMKLWDGPNVIQKEGIYLHGICSSRPLYMKDGKRSILQAIFFGINGLKLIKENFDIIDCCGFPYFSLFTCKLICLLKGKKLNSTWHEVWGKEYWKSYLGNLWMFGYFVERLAVKLPDKIIAVSNDTAERVKNELGYKGPVEVIPNGVDYEAIRSIEPSLTKTDIIYAGRLIDFKNIDLLIKAVEIIKKQYPKIKCVIIDDGPEKIRLQALSYKLKLTENIEFTGFLPRHEDVYALIKSSRVFVLPSIREGFGIVAIEANACGIPVITINHKDNAAKDLITEGENGFICELDEKEIAERIIDVFKKDLDKMTKKICTDSARKYDWDKIANRVEEVYLK